MALAATAFEKKCTLSPLQIIQHRFTMSLLKNMTCSVVPIARARCFSDEPKNLREGDRHGHCGLTATGSIPECRLLARNAQKLTGRYWHHKQNGGKLPSLKKSAFQQPTPKRSLRNDHFHRKVHSMKKLAALCFAVVFAVGAILLWIAFEHGYLPRSSFNSEEWKQAEKADGYPRLAMVDSLIQSGQLDKKAQDEVLTLLGPPTDTNYFSDWDAVYWLGPERGFLRLDSEWLVLRFDAEGRVSEYQLVRD